MKASFRNDFVRPAGAVVVPGAVVMMAQDQVEQEQQEGDEGGEGGESESEEEGEADPESGKEKEGAEAKPTLLQTIAASMKGKGAILAERDTAVADVARLSAELGQERAMNATLKAENASLKAERAEIEKTVAQLSKENTSAEAKAMEIVAGAGVKTEDLPSAETEDQSLEGLEAQMKVAKTDREKWDLQEKINAKMWERN